MTTPLKRLLAGLAASLCLAIATNAGVSEYDLKAALVYKISKFVRWPATDKPPAGAFRVCVAGRDYFGPAIDALKGQVLQGQPLEIVRPGVGEIATAGCQVVFVSRSESGNFAALLQPIAGKAVLTMSDIEGFASHGGIVEFETRNKKLVFRINPDNGRRAGLEISAQLLQLATVVRNEGAQ